MTDITLLGIICLGLAAYALYLRYTVHTALFVFHIVMQGIYDGKVRVTKKDDGRYVPELKEGTGVADH